MSLIEIIITILIYAMLTVFLNWLLAYIGWILPSTIVAFITLIIYVKILLKIVGRNN